MSVSPSVVTKSSLAPNKSSRSVRSAWPRPASVGGIGDSYDNALAETIIGLFKTEVIHQRKAAGASRAHGVDEGEDRFGHGQADDRAARRDGGVGVREPAPRVRIVGTVSSCQSWRREAQEDERCRGIRMS